MAKEGKAREATRVKGKKREGKRWRRREGGMGAVEFAHGWIEQGSGKGKCGEGRGALCQSYSDAERLDTLSKGHGDFVCLGKQTRK